MTSDNGRRTSGQSPARVAIPSTSRINGHRRVLVGPDHPYLTGGLPMDFPSVGHGQNDLFVFQARAFLEQVAGIERLPRCQTFADGLHNIRVLEAVVAASTGPGRTVDRS